MVGYRIVCEGEHWPKIWQARPQSIVRGYVRVMQKPSACSPKPLARIVQIPHVEVTYLGTFDCNDAADLALADTPSGAYADGRN